jgi:hypothetical protein
MRGDVFSDFRERFETTAVDHHVMEMPLYMDLGVVNPDALPQPGPSRTSPQGFDQAIALHDAFLEQLVRTFRECARAVQNESGKNMKRL